AGMTPDHAIAVLWAFVREQSGLPSLKRPKRLIAIDAIPKSGVGKILRRELSSGRYRSLADSGTATPVSP
ncbi:MAG: hypothetical protein ACRDRL_08200, partial [Sciscionella sp.]